MTDVPSRLGELMVQGWVLTDNPCPAPDCGGVPLLRSPKEQESAVQHCVSCDASQIQSQAFVYRPRLHHTPHSPSTPPTEISSNLSSPTFAPPAETEEMRRRREQSDNAVHGNWQAAIEGECVACGTVYMTQSDAEALQHLIPTSSTAEHTSTHPTSGPGLSVIGPTVASNSPQCLQPLQLPTLDPLPQMKAILVEFPTHETVACRGVTAADTAAQALQLALGVLSERLTLACATPNLVDLPSIAETSNAINKVAQALEQVNRLRQQDYGRTSSFSYGAEMDYSLKHLRELDSRRDLLQRGARSKFEFEFETLNTGDIGCSRLVPSCHHIFSLFRNRRDRGDVAAFEDDHGQRGRRYLLKRPSKFFTPLPSRAPTDPEEEYRDEYVQVHSPSTVMGGTLNARPTTLEDPVSPSSLHGYSNRSEYPRLPHDDIPYADMYHEGMAGRGNPEGPVVINHLSRSMSPTSSDRTFKNHRPAALEYPGTRVRQKLLQPISTAVIVMTLTPRYSDVVEAMDPTLPSSRLVVSTARKVTDAGPLGTIPKGFLRFTISFPVEWMSYFKMKEGVKSRGTMDPTVHTTVEVMEDMEVMRTTGIIWAAELTGIQGNTMITEVAEITRGMMTTPGGPSTKFPATTENMRTIRIMKSTQVMANLIVTLL
ncbi:hypothetical protein EDD16DRAFT_1519492 [Pisolithus croceorrhizus]|nr:hypothetical protein EDD16DRAFT_1519492 [Pisolithus croceorrhizus]